jgi:hypothetical protein
MELGLTREINDRVLIAKGGSGLTRIPGRPPPES